MFLFRFFLLFDFLFIEIMIQHFSSQWHRFFMVLTWLMTLASFIVIFIQLGRWSSNTEHASIGLATTILCFIQPFMAAFRPHPGAPKRPLFNWVHWFVGNAAHICASKSTFILITKIQKYNHDFYLKNWMTREVLTKINFLMRTFLKKKNPNIIKSTIMQNSRIEKKSCFNKYEFNVHYKDV